VASSASPPSRRLAIIGGGLTGLTVAVRRLDAGDSVTIFERDARLGGQLWTELQAEFVIELGAEGFVARSEAVPKIAQRLGIADQLIEQELHTSYGFDGQSLRALAPGEAATFLGFQVPQEELGRGIKSFRLGMGQLADGLQHALAGRAALHAGTTVTGLQRTAQGWHLLHSGGRSAAFDQVVVATTAHAAARLLAEPFGAPLAALDQARTLSSVTVSLAFERRLVEHALDGTGFVVATQAMESGCRACTFVSSKFAGRAPASHALLRVFFRPDAAEAELPDADWKARAEAQLQRVLTLSGAPSHAWVSRWLNALPVFDGVHRERVSQAEISLRGSGVHLAGSAFHGSGIDAAVRSAEATASALDA